MVREKKKLEILFGNKFGILCKFVVEKIWDIYLSFKILYHSQLGYFANKPIL